MNSKKTIEALMLGGALVVSVGGMLTPMVAEAATICNLSTTGIGSVVTGDTSSFVKIDFAAKCSPNTVVKFSQSNQAFAAQGGSKKGNTVYGSSSEGGGGARFCGSPTHSDASAAVADPSAAATDGCV